MNLCQPLLGRFSSLLVYNIPMDNVQSLSQAFLQLEKGKAVDFGMRMTMTVNESSGCDTDPPSCIFLSTAKETYNIEEYSFSQATLQQVTPRIWREHPRLFSLLFNLL